MISEETKMRIRKIAGEFSYQPNALAQAVATKRSGVLGFCLYRHAKPYFGHTFFGPLLDGAIEEAKLHGYHIMLAPTDQEDDIFDEHFIKDSIDGVILASFAPRNAALEFQRRNIPLVFVNDAMPSSHNAFVVDDNYGGARMMMDHLITERGHKKIALLSDRLSHPSYYLRYLAYMDAHKDHGLPVYTHSLNFEQDALEGRGLPNADMLGMFGLQPRPIAGTPIIMDSDSTKAVEFIRELARSAAPPTAIFATTDSLAMDAIRAVAQAGLQVPTDIAVAGYDDIDAAQKCTPPLTTIGVNRYEIGRSAVRELLAQIDRPDQSSRMIIVKNQIIIREST